jgi:hypothetical protein
VDHLFARTTATAHARAEHISQSANFVENSVGVRVRHMPNPPALRQRSEKPRRS